MTDISRELTEKYPALACKARSITEQAADDHPNHAERITQAKATLRAAEAEHTAHVEASQAVRDARETCRARITAMEERLAQHDADVQSVTKSYAIGEIGDTDMDDFTQRRYELQGRIDALREGIRWIEREIAGNNRIGESKAERTARASEHLRSLREGSSLDLARYA